jgi:hypothetical protein
MISPHPADDLALLHLRFLPPEMHHMEFYEPQSADRAAPVRKQVILHGFPWESSRILRIEGETAGAVFPYFDYLLVTRVTKEVTEHLRHGILQYRPIIHFLLGFPSLPPDSPLLKDPRGLSGGGLWKGPRMGKDTVWSPTKARLVGILIGWSPRREVLVATRSNRVWRLLEAWANAHKTGTPTNSTGV